MPSNGDKILVEMLIIYVATNKNKKQNRTQIRWPILSRCYIPSRILYELLHYANQYNNQYVLLTYLSQYAKVFKIII